MNKEEAEKAAAVVEEIMRKGKFNGEPIVGLSRKKLLKVLAVLKQYAGVLEYNVKILRDKLEDK